MEKKVQDMLKAAMEQRGRFNFWFVAKKLRVQLSEMGIALDYGFKAALKNSAVVDQQLVHGERELVNQVTVEYFDRETMIWVGDLFAYLQGDPLWEDSFVSFENINKAGLPEYAFIPKFDSPEEARRYLADRTFRSRQREEFAEDRDLGEHFEYLEQEWEMFPKCLFGWAGGPGEGFGVRTDLESDDYVLTAKQMEDYAEFKKACLSK